MDSPSSKTRIPKSHPDAPSPTPDPQEAVEKVRTELYKQLTGDEEQDVAVRGID